MMRRLVSKAAFLVLLVGMIGCGSSEQRKTSSAPPVSSESQPASQPTADSAPKRYHLEGTVVSIDRQQKRVIVDGKDIPGFMAAMTMPYPVADDQNSFQVCEEAKDGKEAVEQVQKLKPDIVLLDIHMPVMDGVEAAQEIRRISPQTKIVFLTMFDTPAVMRASRMWSDAFVSKSFAGTELIPTLSRLAGIPPDGPIKAREPQRTESTETHGERVSLRRDDD